MSDTDNGRFVSPNEMLEAAKQHMLGGNEPKEWEDYARILNFVAFNTMKGVEVPVTKLFVLIYQFPISEAEAEQIAEFQAKKKKK